jgi:hypothetical protein
MRDTPGLRQPEEEPDKAWLWIAGSVVLGVILICAVLYARALDYPAAASP